MDSRLRANVAVLQAHRRRDRESAGWATRLANLIGQLAGSVPFACIHAVVFGFWALANWGLLPEVPRFDSTFVGLATFASVEAIFLSTFVLISQNRLAADEELRADLDLHVDLLAEHELTRLASVIERIADKLGVEIEDREEFAEVKQDVEPGDVLDTVEATKRSEG